MENSQQPIQYHASQLKPETQPMLEDDPFDELFSYFTLPPPPPQQPPVLSNPPVAKKIKKKSTVEKKRALPKIKIPSREQCALIQKGESNKEEPEKSNDKQSVYETVPCPMLAMQTSGFVFVMCKACIRKTRTLNAIVFNDSRTYRMTLNLCKYCMNQTTNVQRLSASPYLFREYPQTTNQGEQVLPPNEN